MIFTIGGLLREGSEDLYRAGLEQPAREARRLLAWALGEPFLKTTNDAKVPWFFVGRFRRGVECRARGVPWSALEGTTAFLDFEVLVPPGVFAPRPETEELAELAIRVFREIPKEPRALDLGTGTGVLALALARSRPDVTVVATDLSSRALRAARENAERLRVQGQIQFLRSDWFEGVSGKFHVIVANPPYVATPELARLDRAVRDHDPRRALGGGPDGLRVIRKILREAPPFLHPQGTILLEIGPGHAQKVLQFAHSALDLVETKVLKDLAGMDRFFVGRCG